MRVDIKFLDRKYLYNSMKLMEFETRKKMSLK